jgi:hypothetical protein
MREKGWKDTIFLISSTARPKFVAWKPIFLKLLKTCSKINALVVIITKHSSLMQVSECQSKLTLTLASKSGVILPKFSSGIKGVDTKFPGAADELSICV